MTETDSRKSMDDVLASIRRIVRAERETTDDRPGETSVVDAKDEKPAVSGEVDAPLALTPDMMRDTSTPTAVDTVEDAVIQNDAAPVARETKTLPPVDDANAGGAAKASEPTATDIFAPPPQSAPAAVAAPDPDQIREMVHDAVREEMAKEAMQQAVREMIRAELTASSTQDAIREMLKAELAADDNQKALRDTVKDEISTGVQDPVREIIKAELTTGEIGGNISRNVLRLIKSEIAKSRE